MIWDVELDDAVRFGSIMRWQRNGSQHSIYRHEQVVVADDEWVRDGFDISCYTRNVRVSCRRATNQHRTGADLEGVMAGCSGLIKTMSTECIEYLRLRLTVAPASIANSSTYKTCDQR